LAWPRSSTSTDGKLLVMEKGQAIARLKPLKFFGAS
jgi:hypothetical protein